jgi:rod shape-determining protein MreC
MTSMLADRAARRRGIAFGILLVLTLLMMAFSSNPAVKDVQNGVGYAFRPFQAALDTAAGGIASVASAIAEIDRLRTDNASLRDENARLAAENARLQEIKRENDQLTGLLQLQNGFEFRTAAAAVIGRESSEFKRTVTIDKGSDQGISVGDVVVATGGSLAGRVTDVGPDSANVLLLTDAESTVIGQLVPNAATGEVVGQLGGVLVMNQIDSGERINLGDEVVTAGLTLASGIRSPYPKGLLIGQVVDVKRDANDVVQTAFLQPTADLDKLEYVQVILDYAGGLPPIEQQPQDCSTDKGVLPAGEQPCYDPNATPKPTPRPTPAPTPAP